jgi:uncharacterized protein YndB with AHSA1/START domain
VSRLLRLAVVGAIGGWIIDRWLGARASADGQTTPAPVATLIVIDAPIERVWARLADIERQPEWMTDMKSVRMDTPGAVGLGSTGEATVRMMGVAVRDPVTITAFEPPVHFAVRHEGRFSGEGVMRLEAGADGTTTILRWEETLVAPVFPWLAAVLLRPLFRSVFQADLRRLRDLVESDAAGASGRAA